MNHDSPSEIRACLEARGLALKKRWGQNFLVNRGARERLCGLLELRAGAAAWEIGPGLGSMTEMLLGTGARVIAFEVDRGLCRWLEEGIGARQAGFRLVAGDFLRTWRAERDAAGAPARLLGNLPYRSASLMIADMVEGGLRPEVSVVTVQKELAERMLAAVGGRNYSSFSVLCQACFAMTGRGELKPGSFYPAPEVTSSIVELRPRADGPDARGARVLSALLRAMFAARRKTLRNNAAHAGNAAGGQDLIVGALERAGIDLGARAEEVGPDAWAAVAADLSRGSQAP